MSTQRAHLLVVDDDVDLRTTLPMILTRAGYQVRSAEDGFSALAQIRSEAPDILISDLNMPGMSGFELLSVVRRRFPSIRVIAMSSAFSGHDVPVGVDAEEFHEKATGVPALLSLVERLAIPRSPQLRSMAARNSLTSPTSISSS
jgi:DNA-binding NtrC family response regulator